MHDSGGLGLRVECLRVVVGGVGTGRERQETGQLAGIQRFVFALGAVLASCSRITKRDP